MGYFVDKFRGIFQVKDSPRRIAMAFAVGVFMGISPLIGLHYIGAFFLAWIFRLNKLVAIIGASVNNPWTLVPISSFSVWTGAKMMGIKQVLPEIDWEGINLTTIISGLTDMEKFLSVVDSLMPLIKAFFAGSLVLCTISGIMSYFIIHILAVKYRKVKDAD